MALVHHLVIPKKSSTNKRSVKLPASLQINSCKCAVDCKSKAGNVNLRQMHIHFLAAVDSRQRSALIGAKDLRHRACDTFATTCLKIYKLRNQLNLRNRIIYYPMIKHRHDGTQKLRRKPRFTATTKGIRLRHDQEEWVDKQIEADPEQTWCRMVREGLDLLRKKHEGLIQVLSVDR